MKKTIKLFVALSIVATLLSGCITATVLMTKWAIDEQKEIKSGKVFKEAQGTVEYSTDAYSSGKIVLQFKEYGKYIYITKPNKDFILITPTDVYKGNITDQTFRHAKNTDGNYYFSDLSMVFPVEWFRWEKFSEYMIADDTNKIEGTDIDILSDAFFHFFLDERCLPVSRCYELVKEWTLEFRPELYGNIPCERTFRRMAEALPEAVVVLSRQGEKAMKDGYIPYVERLYEDFEANGIWVADNHTVDFITAGENGRTHRLYLTAFFDAKSGGHSGTSGITDPIISSNSSFMSVSFE